MELTKEKNTQHDSSMQYTTDPIMHSFRKEDLTKEKIREIIIEQLQVDESEVTMDTNLMKDLSADSLDAVEIIMAIEDEYGIEIPDEEAEKFQTVRDLVKYVEESK